MSDQNAQNTQTQPAAATQDATQATPAPAQDTTAQTGDALTEGSTAAQEAPQISMKDIILVERIISAASNRGAFQAQEMSTVGGVYDKLKAFIEFHNPEQTQDNKEGGDNT